MITVYSKSDCKQCDATKKKLDILGADYTVVDAINTPGATDTLIDLGYRGLPVVTFADQHWGGYSPDKLAAAAAAQRAAA